jgi:hypothetical protein
VICICALKSDIVFKGMMVCVQGIGGIVLGKVILCSRDWWYCAQGIGGIVL